MEKNPREFYGLSRTELGPIGKSEEYFHTASRTSLLQRIAAELGDGCTVIAIRGGHGIGKTRLFHALRSELDARQFTSVGVTDASVDRVAIQRLITDVAGICDDGSMSLDQLLTDLRVHQGIERLVLVFDDAHDLSEIVFRYISQLTKTPCSGATVVSVVLFGNEGAWSGLDSPDLKDLRKAAVSRHFIAPFSQNEADAYLRHKFSSAGGSLPDTVSKAALAMLISQADGYPSRLNAITELARAHSSRTLRKRITARTVRQISAKHPYQSTRTQRGRLPGLRATIVLLIVMLVPAAVIITIRSYTPAAGTGRNPLGADLQSDVEARDAPGTSAAIALKPVSPRLFTAERPDVAVARDEPPAAAVALPVQIPETPASKTIIGPSADPASTASVDQLYSIRAAPQPDRRQAGLLDRFGSLDFPHKAARDGGPGLVLVVGQGDSLATLYAKVYRGLDPPPYAVVLAANRLPVRSGSLVVFPEPQNGWTP
jgi:type II secretory pathway predicted ATPase ExeA